MSDTDFSTFDFDTAHEFHNNLKFYIYHNFNCVLVIFKQNVKKSSNSLRIKYIKSRRSTTNTLDKEEQQMKDNILYKSYDKNKNHPNEM